MFGNVICLVDGVGNVRLHTVPNAGDTIGIPHPTERGEIVPFVRTDEITPLDQTIYRQRAWLDLDKTADVTVATPWEPVLDSPELRVKVYIIDVGDVA